MVSCIDDWGVIGMHDICSHPSDMRADFNPYDIFMLYPWRVRFGSKMMFGMCSARGMTETADLLMRWPCFCCDG